ncbi:MAG: diaminopimelate decarboxylase [Nanoarchaeota archaeon]|nr:diaminopimelate decarboxylase [Nanoarchaeota archaeon]
MIKKLPFSKEKILEITKKYRTPFLIYDEKGIRENARRLKKAFKDIEGFEEFFAVKACPNPYIMKILREEGFGMDCSSLPEILLAEKVGVSGEDIMFSSNNTPAEEYKKASESGAIINVDDISHINFLDDTIGIPDLICFRYNPGPARQGNVIIGDPKEAKYGLTKAQLIEGYRIMKEKGVKRFGLHTMIISNELNREYFIDTAIMLFDLVVEISKKLDIRFEFVNLGGGIGIPLRPDEKPVSFEFLADGIKKAYSEKISANGLGPLKIYMECGRVITGPFGYLVMSVRHMKHTYKDYVGTDSSMADFMRPAIYGAYHHLTVLGKENKACDHKYDVTGSLCENNDKFAIDRMLPEIEVGDILVLHDAGAHGKPMGFNYNGKLRCGELLLRENNEVIQIRRQETVEDYFATLDFKQLEKFKV